MEDKQEIMYGLSNNRTADDLEWCWRSIFCVVNLCDTHNSRNIACFDYSVSTHKLESECGLWLLCDTMPVLYVCLSICLSHNGIVSKRLNLWSHRSQRNL